MRLQIRRSRQSERTGYVGDHADKLSRIRPGRYGDERPTREDLDYDRTMFNSPWWEDMVPRFMTGRRRRPPRS